jgi:diamine N-acetyltransferase
MLLIRPATLDDIPTIQKIAADTWPTAYGAIISLAQISYMLDMMYSTSALTTQMTTRGHHFLLAILNSDAVGFASYELNATPNQQCKLHKLYCLPQSQGSGVGAQLVGHVADAAITANQHAIMLNVNKHNKALGFYQRLGFAVIDEVVIDIGQGYLMDDFVLEKVLSNPPIT